MELKLKELNKVKNELLLELDDLLFDTMTDLMAGLSSNKENQDDTSKELTQTIMRMVSKNKIKITTICYTDINNNTITEDQAKTIPMLSFKITKDVLPFILEIITDQMSGEETKGEGKQERPTITRS